MVVSEGKYHMSFMDNVKRSTIRTGTTSEFFTSFEWDYKFIGEPKVLENTNIEWNDFQNIMRARTISVTPPEDPIPQNMTVNIRGHRFQQVGDVPAYGQAGIQVQDFSDARVMQVLHKLIYSQADPVTKATDYIPRQYLFDMEFYRLDPTRKVVKVWRCKDCLIQGVDVSDDMTSDKHPVGVINIVISIDLYTIEYVELPSTALGASYYGFASNKSLASYGNGESSNE